MNTSKYLLYFLAVGLILLLAACTTPSATEVPTRLPAQVPTSSSTPTAVPASPTAPIATHTPTPRGVEPTPTTIYISPAEAATVYPQGMRPPSLLPPGAIARFGKGYLSTLIYSPAGHLLAVGTSVGVCVYDVDSFQERWCDRSEDGVQRLAFKPDETALAAGLWNGGIVIWNAATGTRIAFRNINRADAVSGLSTYGYMSPSEGIPGLAWWPEGNQLVTLTAYGDFPGLNLWDGSTLRHVMKLAPVPAPENGLTNLSVSPDGATIAWNESGWVSLWDIAKGERSFTLPLPEHQATSLSWTPDGGTLIVLSTSNGERGTLAFWNVRTGELTRSVDEEDLLGGKGWFWASAVNPEGDRLAVGVASYGEPNPAGAGSILVLDMETLKPIATFSDVWRGPAPAPFLYHPLIWTWTPDGQWLVHWNAGLTSWNLETGETEPFLAEFTEYWSASLSTDGQLLATTNDFDKVQVLDAQTGEILLTLATDSETIGDIRWAPHKNLFAYYVYDEVIISPEQGIFEVTTSDLRYWDVTASEGGSLLSQPIPVLVSFRWSPSGDEIALVYTNTVTLMDVDSGQVIKTFESGSEVNSEGGITWSPNGKWLALPRRVNSTYEIQIWNTSTEQVENTIPMKSIPESLTWMPGRDVLAVVTDLKIVFWDVLTGESVLELPTTYDTLGPWLSSLAFSPDGHILAFAGGLERQIILWDTTSGEIHSLIEGYTGQLTFSPDGTLLYSADGTIIIWQVP